jgi:hypothetical protein
MISPVGGGTETIHRPRARNARSALDPGPYGQPVDALKDRVVQSPNLLIASIRTHGIDPEDKPTETDRVDLHVVVLAA